MNPMTKEKLHNSRLDKVYLDYFNNFLTIRAFAEHYNLTISSAKRIVRLYKKAYYI